MSNIPPLLNIIGDRYGMLLVIKEEPPKYYINNRGWSQIIRIFKCKCDCGNFNSVRMGNLRGGSTISCGCQLGVSQKHGRSGTPEHRSWAALCKRVKSNSPKSKKYYKDKGIVVCSRWLGKDGFANFLNDMGKKPSERHGVLINGKEYEYCFVCLRDRFDFSDKAHGTLSHEVIHICTHNLSNMFDIVRENEAFAYTHTHILNQCYSVLRNKK